MNKLSDPYCSRLRRLCSYQASRGVGGQASSSQHDATPNAIGSFYNASIKCSVFGMQSLTTLNSRNQQQGRSSMDVSAQPQLQCAASNATPVKLTHLTVAQRRWVDRFKHSMHVCGIGKGPQQLRARHVALVDSCLPGWDAQWQSKLYGAKKVLKDTGAGALPPTMCSLAECLAPRVRRHTVSPAGSPDHVSKTAPADVAELQNKRRVGTLTVWLKDQVESFNSGTLSQARVRLSCVSCCFCSSVLCTPF